jgi:nucleotide-binding universal stress UspA family protein
LFGVPVSGRGEIVMARRFLVPLDGSPTADRGLAEALRLARPLDASLVLLHVVESYPMMIEMATTSTWETVANGLREQGQNLLERARRSAREAGIAAEAYLDENAAARVCDLIVEQAREHHCDMIVMGTHGRRGVQHALMGSDAERVVRQSKVPVLLVPGA